MSRNTVEEPVSTTERREVASKFLKDMDLRVPALLDNIDDKTSTDYASHPDRIYLVGKNGKIAFAGEKGPRGFKPDELEQAILAETGSKPANQSSPRTSESPVRGGRGNMAEMMKRFPVVQALDADGNGSLSAREIENAATALRALDKDKNGKLTTDELRPTRPSGGGRNRN